RGGPGAEPERYRQLAERLGDLPTSVEIARLFQLDMVKSAIEPVIGAAVVEEICRAVALMRRLVQKPPDPFERFRKDFSDRYGDGREVPLIEVLDEEIGIGFERSGGAGAEASPLLRGLALPSPAADPTTPWTQKQAFLLSRLSRALAAGEEEIALSDDEAAKLASAPAAPAAGADASFAASSSERAISSSPAASARERRESRNACFCVHGVVGSAAGEGSARPRRSGDASAPAPPERSKPMPISSSS